MTSSDDRETRQLPGSPRAPRRAVKEGPLFKEDETVAGRYRVVRLIAEGGMGEVYEAFDLHLRENVALKTLKSESLEDEIAVERSKREIQLARRVTHPNVCRVFDFGIHPTPNGDVTFLTMELLNGETLQDLILKKGSLSVAEATPIVAQIVDALAAAHEAGVIHRDLKAANVILVPASGGVRAVVTDFGLAHPSAKSGDASITRTGNVVGTLATMAPEQLVDGEITTAVDVYALGVVMYEMVSGKGPFDGMTAISSALKRLREKAPSAKSVVPLLPTQWDATIARCLEIDPKDRFRSVRDVLRSLPDEEWLSTALTEMLGTELAAGEKLRTIPGEDVARMKMELKAADFESPGAATLAKIRANLKSDLAVSGAYLALGDRNGPIRLDVRLQDAATGETLAQIAETGAAPQLFDLVSKVGARLRVPLGMGNLSEADVARVKMSLPENAEAARLYASGLAKLRSFDTLAARELLEKAATIEPRFPLVHQALSTAFASMGYDEKAREASARAVSLAGSLPRGERLLVEEQDAETRRDFTKAVEIARALCQFFPDDLDYGLRLVSAQRGAGKGRDALDTVQTLRKLPPPAGDDPRLDLAEAQAAQAVSEFPRAKAAAAQAAAKGGARGARLVVARARRLEALAHHAVGEEDDAVGKLNEALQIYADLYDRFGRASTLAELATIHWQRGNLTASLAASDEALGLFREVGNQAGIAAGLNNRANVARDRGDLRESRQLYEQVIAIYRETGDRAGVARSQNNIAGNLADEGRLDESRPIYEESLATKRELGDKIGVARTLGNLANLLAEGGDLEGAKKRFEESLALRREVGERAGLAFSTKSLGDVLLAQGDVAGARAQYEQSLALATGLGEKSQAADTRLALARVLTHEGRFADAQREAGEVATYFKSEERPNDEAAARVVEIRAALKAGDVPAAREAAGRAEKLVASSQRRPLQLRVAVAVACVKARDGAEAVARASLERVAKESTVAGLPAPGFEARLALGEMLLSARRVAEGKKELADLARAASAKGYGLVAREAESAATRVP